MLRFVFIAIICSSYGSRVNKKIAGYPSVKLISPDERTHVNIYTPDAINGYYRSTRFDWTSMIGPIQWNNHTIFQNFRTVLDPTAEDNAVGFAEEWGQGEAGVNENGVLGWKDAPIGGQVLKLGVGALIKNNDEYQFWSNIKLARPANFAVINKTKNMHVTKTSDSLNEWAYQIIRNVTVVNNRMYITNTLENTGNQTISTQQYSHDFLSVDNISIGGGYSINFPLTDMSYKPQPDWAPTGFEDAGGMIKGGNVSFSKPMAKMKLTFLSLPPKGIVPGWTFRYGDVFVTRRKVMLPSLPIKYQLYAEATALCPEIFRRLTVAPGENISFMDEISFHSNSNSNSTFNFS